MDSKNRLILDQAANPKTMQDFFQRRLLVFYPGARLSSFELKDQSPYQYKKSVRYTLGLTYPSGKKVIKIIRANVPSAHQPWEIKVSDQSLKYLYNHGFNAGIYQVSRPLGHYPKRRLQLYEEFPGEIFSELILKGVRNLDKETLLVSNWVARFHNLKAKIGRPKSTERFKQEIGFFIKNYKNYSVSCYNEGSAILKVFWKNFKKYNHPSKHQLIHGDLNTNNIIFNKNVVGVIDFGNSWKFNSSFDVANYLVQAELLVWQREVPQKLIQKLNYIFIQNYLKKTNSNKKTLEEIYFWKVWWLMQITAFSVTLLIDTKKNRADLEKTVLSYTFPEAKRILKL